MKTYNIETQFIDQYGPAIFNYFDKDKSGSLTMNEAPQMFFQLFEYLKQPQPTQQDIMYTLSQHDTNHDGKMDYQEFRKMMYFLAGKPIQ